MVVHQNPGCTHVFETLTRDQRDFGFPLKVQRSSSDMGTGFLPDYHGLQCDHDIQTKPFIYFKERELYQVFPLFCLAHVSLWCLSAEQSGRRYFSVNHYSAIFFCFNRFGGPVLSLVSVRFMHLSEEANETAHKRWDSICPTQTGPVQTYAVKHYLVSAFLTAVCWELADYSVQSLLPAFSC